MFRIWIFRKISERNITNKWWWHWTKNRPYNSITTPSHPLMTIIITINNNWSWFGENMNMNVYWNTGQGTCHHLVTLIMGERLSNKRTQKGQKGNVSCDILYAFDAWCLGKIRRGRMQYEWWWHWICHSSSCGLPSGLPTSGLPSSGQSWCGQC